VGPIGLRVHALHVVVAILLLLLLLLLPPFMATKECDSLTAGGLTR